MEEGQKKKGFHNMYSFTLHVVSRKYNFVKYRKYYLIRWLSTFLSLLHIYSQTRHSAGMDPIYTPNYILFYILVLHT